MKEKSVDIEFSIITPVFNREADVVRSISSSLIFLDQSGVKGEIIVVDDASSDDSSGAVVSTFKEYINNGVIKLITLTRNIGPTGAKQIGVSRSSGKWLIFMDSDDEFALGNECSFVNIIKSISPKCPIVFFRCVNKDSGVLIGPQQLLTNELKLDVFLKTGTPGECLPAVRRECLLKIPFQEDLRGFEGLTYALIIREFGSAYLADIVLRLYCTGETEDRLSSRKTLKRRGCLIAKGYIRIIFYFGLSLRSILVLNLLKFFYHAFNCLIYSNFARYRINK